jgi:phosphatidylglycerol:prolipoprotein diacylglycerol transferase
MHPVLFKIFGIEIYTYGILVAVGFIVGISIAIKEGERYGIEAVKMIDLSFFVVISGLLGARIFFAITEPEFFRDQPLSVLKIWEGGFVWYGGFILAVITCFIYSVLRKIDFIKLLDALAPSAAIGLSIGRWGCFSAGCCYGKITLSKVGVVFKDIRSIAPLDIPLHPTQIYMSFANYLVFLILMASREEKILSVYDLYAIIFFFLVRFYAYDFPFNPLLDISIFVIYLSIFFWFKFLLSKALSPLRKRQFKGMGASIYLLTYPVFRFIIEFFRGDPRGSVGPFSTSQFIGLFAFSAGVFLFFYMKNKR